MAEKWAYTLAEVAEGTGFSERSLKDLCRAGKLTHVRFGNTLAMRPEHIDELLARYTHTGAEAPDADELERQRVLNQLQREQARDAAA